jgi:crotonobetainyl-CoA:carnitine CoA-transferase CaiB-like acyl-CoA transferase
MREGRARQGVFEMTLAANDKGSSTKSFQGLRVLDFSTTIAGPHCTRMLADMGAEVIKIEPAEGETMRTRPPLRNNFSSVFGQLNVGKKSIVLDLKSPKAIDIVRHLVASTDILVENFRPGVMQRLKLDYGSLHELNPRLIYCSISGYGQSGPSAELPAYAPVIHAASGYDMAHMSYQPGRSRPDYCGIYHADVVTGVYAFAAISAALYQLQRSRKGQYIDVSMLESMLSLTLNEVQWSQFEVALPSRPMYGPVETADGYVMVAIASEKTFQSLVTASGCFDREMPRQIEWSRCSLFGLSHRCPGLERSPNRPSWRAGRGGRRRRHVQGHESAVPDVRSQCRGRQADRNLGRAHRCLAHRERSLGRRNSGFLGETAGGRATLTVTGCGLAAARDSSQSNR